MREIEPERLVFLDESGATTEMTRRYGRAPRGERIREATPAGHWETLTLLGAMTQDGMLASMTVDAPTDGEVFLAYLDQVLCPALRPGHVVVMDNLSA
ncbi:MAG TPA: transposase, partial [Terriglobia bacterium]